MKLFLSILLTLTFIQNYAQAAKDSAFSMISVAKYAKLNDAKKLQYVNSVRKALYEFEIEQNKFQKLSQYEKISVSLWPVAEADDKFCVIGGAKQPLYDDKCSSKNRGANCKDISDGFQCGEVFNNKCIERNPVGTISSRCFHGSEDAKLTADEYAKVKKNAEILYKEVCSDTEKLGCKILKRQMDKLNKSVGYVDIKFVSKKVDGGQTESAQILPDTITSDESKNPEVASVDNKEPSVINRKNEILDTAQLRTIAIHNEDGILHESFYANCAQSKSPGAKAVVFDVEGGKPFYTFPTRMIETAHDVWNIDLTAFEKTTSGSIFRKQSGGFTYIDENKKSSSVKIYEAPASNVNYAIPVDYAKDSACLSFSKHRTDTDPAHGDVKNTK